MPVDLTAEPAAPAPGVGGASVNAYLRTKVLTASPEELRLLLLDGAIKFAHQGREGLLSRQHEAAYAGLTQCRNIVLELLTTIRAEINPDLAERVRSVYSFLYTELTTALLERDPGRLDKVLQILEFERETWVMLMSKLAEERAAAKPAAQTGANPGARAAISMSA